MPACGVANPPGLGEASGLASARRRREQAGAPAKPQPAAAARRRDVAAGDADVDQRVDAGDIAFDRVIPPSWMAWQICIGRAPAAPSSTKVASCGRK